MKRSDLKALLDNYSQQRGWSRYFFGNSSGLSQLQHFYDELPAVDTDELLSLEQLQKIEALLSDRALRLKDRKDNYFKELGLNKLSNQIYRELAKQLATRYQALGHGYSHSLLMPYIENPTNSAGVALDLLPIEDLYIFQQKGHYYALHPQHYAEHMTIKHAWQNPFTKKMLSQTVQDYLEQHQELGSKFQQFKTILTNLPDNLWAKHVLDNSWRLADMEQTESGIIYHRPTALKLFLDELKTLSYQTLNEHRAVYDKIYKEQVEDEAIKQDYITVLARFLGLKNLNSASLIAALQDKPAYELFIDRFSTTAFSLVDFLAEFEQSGRMVNPVNGKKLPHAVFSKVVAEINRRSDLAHNAKAFVAEVKSLGFLYDQQKYQMYCHVQDCINKTCLDGITKLYTLPSQSLFITEDNYGFELNELYSSFSIGSGLQNPYSKQAFSQKDIQKLMKEPVKGGLCKKFIKILLALPNGVWGIDNIEQDWKLSDMGISPDNRVFKTSHAIERLAKNLNTMTLAEYQQDSSIYNALLQEQVLEQKQAKAYQFLSSKAEGLLKLPSIDLQRLEGIPLSQILLCQTKDYAFSCDEFLSFYQQENKILNPINSQPLSYSDFLNLVKILHGIKEQNPQSESFIETIKSLELIANRERYQVFSQVQRLKNQMTLELKKPLFDLPQEQLFITEDNYGFDVIELIEQFSLSKQFINPITQQALSKDDLEKLKQHKRVKYRVAHGIELIERVSNIELNQAIADLPIEQVLYTNSGLVDLATCFDSESLQLLANPIDKQPFSFEEYKKIDDLKKEALQSEAETPLAMQYQLYRCRLQGLDETQAAKSFITEDNHLFEIDDLLKSFTTDGFINPKNGMSLSALDLETLALHPTAKNDFQVLTQRLELWHQLTTKPKLEAKAKLCNLFITEQNDCIDISQTPVNTVVERHLKGSITKEDLRLLLQRYYQDKPFVNGDISERNFWDLMDNEVKLQLTYVSEYPICLVMAIQDFSHNPKPFVEKAGEDKNIIFSTIAHGKVHIERTDEIKGKAEALAAINLMVAQFKADLVEAFKLNKMDDLFDLLNTEDNYQRCILKVSNDLNNWLRSLNEEAAPQTTSSLKESVSQSFFKPETAAEPSKPATAHDDAAQVLPCF